MSVSRRTGRAPRPETGRDARPYVRSFEPAARLRPLFRIGNAALIPMLRSRLGARMADLALLSFTGCRTGKRYTVPVGHHELDGRAVILTASGWKANLRGGADVELVRCGVAEPMRALLVDGPDEVADVYRTLLARVGLAKATRIGLKVAGERMPTHEEMVAGIAGAGRSFGLRRAERPRPTVLDAAGRRRRGVLRSGGFCRTMGAREKGGGPACINGRRPPR